MSLRPKSMDEAIAMWATENTPERERLAFMDGHVAATERALRIVREEKSEWPESQDGAIEACEEIERRLKGDSNG